MLFGGALSSKASWQGTVFLASSLVVTSMVAKAAQRQILCLKPLMFKGHDVLCGEVEGRSLSMYFLFYKAFACKKTGKGEAVPKVFMDEE